jgi:arylsulfatase B
MALRAAAAAAAFSVALLQVAGAAGGSSPHLIQMLVDDWGWFNVGWHQPSPNPEVVTPNLDALVQAGVELDNAYIFKYCSPSRCALQTGRNPLQVNVLNDDMVTHNVSDPVGGWAGAARNFTAIANKLSAAGYATHQVGKWASSLTRAP